MSNEHLLSAVRYVEQNPVRAGMIKNAEDYPWSSYHYYAHGHTDPLITRDPMYMAPGKTEEAQQVIYRDFIEEGLTCDSVADQSVFEPFPIKTRRCRWL